MKQQFNIKGMTCSACSSAIDRQVRQLDGVEEVQVNLLSNTMDVTYDQATANQIIQAVQDAGYDATTKDDEAIDTKQYQTLANKMKMRFIYSLIFMLPLFYISMGHMMEWPLPSIFHTNPLFYAYTQLVLTIPIVVINREFFIHGFKSLYKRNPNMDSLIALGSTAAILYGLYAIAKITIGLNTNNSAMVMQFTMDLYFETSAMILTLITLGKYLETKSKGKTSEAISKLIDLSP